MKKVLLVTGTLNTGGLELFAINTVKLLSKKEYSFDFLIFSDKKQDYEEEIKKMGCEIIRIKNPKKKYFKFKKQLKEVIKSHGPYDIVHSHIYYSSGMIMKIAKKNNVATCISHSHSIVRENDKKIIRKIIHSFMRKKINKYSDYKIACTLEAGENLFGKEIFDKNGIIITNPIDIQKYSFDLTERNKIRKKLKIKKNQLVIGQVSRLVEGKNQFFLLELFKKNMIDINSVLILVGDGDLRKKLEDYATKLKIKKNVRFLGKRDDVDSLLSAMDIFVMTSLHEGLGMVIIEALANGLPCICEEKAIVKQVRDLNNCITMKGFNIDAWNNEIKIYHKRETEKSIIKNTLAQYSEKKFINEMNKIYSNK